VLKRFPFLKVLAFAQIGLLVRRHLLELSPKERRRLRELAKRLHKLSPKERRELSRLLGKLQPRAFAAGAADAFSPLPLPKRLLGGKRRGA
jgi:hypothetical protein